jgi:hypothetical protein
MAACVEKLRFDKLDDVPPIILESRTTIWAIEPGSVQDAHQILDHWSLERIMVLKYPGDWRNCWIQLEAPQNGSFCINFAPYNTLYI